MRTLALLALVVAALACGAGPTAPPDAAQPCGGACGAGTVCSAGRCVAEDAGVDAAPEAGPDAAPDAALDAAEASPCPEGFGVCSGRCVDFRSTLEHCGACGSPCFAWGYCMAGRCTRADLDAGLCPAGRRDCNQAGADECEVDITSSSMNCGACGRACVPVRERCAAGVCVPQ